MSWSIHDGDLLAGKYRVERTLGAGGMGVVLAAWHTELEQRVAIKLLKPEVAERSDAAERFRREARAAVRIKSEHVARVFDVGTLEAGAPFMVMEYLEGHDMDEELRRSGALKPREAVDYLLQACEAVAEAHALGIVHRDLKPANLFIADRPGGSRIVKVLDFGISKSLTESSDALSLTATSSLMGSPLYMSPEQMQSARSVDARTDIWSLGAILYEALAGSRPYAAETIPELCSKLLKEDPPSLGVYREDLPEGLEQVVFRCLEKDRTLRFATVAELAVELIPYGSRTSHVHAERAQRVLGVTDVRMTGAGQLRSSSSAVPARTGGADAEAARHPTLNSWGKTGGDLLATGSKRARWAVLGSGGLLAAALFGGYFLLHRTSPRPAVAPRASAAGAPASSFSLPPSPAVTTSAEPVVEPASKDAAPESTDAGDAGPAANSSARAKPHHATRTRRVWHHKIRKPVTHKAPTVKAPMIPNFGGRR